MQQYCKYSDWFRKCNILVPKVFGKFNRDPSVEFCASTVYTIAKLLVIACAYCC